MILQTKIDYAVITEVADRILEACDGARTVDAEAASLVAYMTMSEVGRGDAAVAAKRLVVAVREGALALSQVVERVRRLTDEELEAAYWLAVTPSAMVH